MKTQTIKPPVMNTREILRFFSPRWFIAIMGTGAVANILQILSGRNEGLLHTSAVVLLSAALMAFPIAFMLLISRLGIDRKMLVKELEHSSLVQFYSAVFIAAGICATGLLKIPLPFLSQEMTLQMAKIFWFAALSLGICAAVLTPWRIITMNHGEIRRILGFWFLPPVGLFVVVFSGNFLALRTADSRWIEAIALINAFLLGTALLLSLMIFTCFLLRALTYPFPKNDVVPSFTIGLAPVGVSIIALLSYLPVLKQAPTWSFLPLTTLTPLIQFGSLLLWGFGLWWLMVSTLISITGALKGGIPTTLGYWAFIFPPAAFTLATLLLGQSTGILFMQLAGKGFALIVTLGWVMVTWLTIRGTLDRSIFTLPPSFSEILPPAIHPDAGEKIAYTLFNGKFPVYSVDIAKDHFYRNLSDLTSNLKEKISMHPVACHIADFDHFNHTQRAGGEMVPGLKNATNLIFCFGPKIEDAKMMAVRPRSFGIAEFDNHFTISFLEAPSENANKTMLEWVHSLMHHG
jgi:tellurite resistance protein TehA-like permease